MGKTIYTSKGDSVSYNKNTWTYNVNGTTYTSATAAANALSNWVGRGTFSSWTSTSSSSSSGSSTKSSNNNFVDPSVLQDAQVNWYTPEQIDAKWWTGTASNVNTYDKTYWTNSFSLAGGYSSWGSSTTSAVNTGIRSVSSPYTNQWAWNYSYNPTTWYYHKIVNNGTENQGVSYWEDQNHYGILNTNEKVTPDSTYKRDNNTDLSNPLLNWWLTDTDNINTNIDLVGDKNTNLNKFWDFATAVNNKLQTAYGIQDLNELKQKYPEQYSSLIQSLSSVAWVWNATDPSQRWLLDWQLQAIIWTAVGAWSDTSKLNVLNESLMNKFENWQQVAEDMRNIIKLQTEWKSTGQIAKQMWISEDQVQQAVLAYNWLDNRLWEYYKLKSGEANEITEPYDTKMQRLEQEKKIALDRANREIEWLKQDFDTNLARQKQVNEQNEHNADFMSGQYWFGFSKRGLEWLDYVQEQAQQIIDDMVKNYDRANIEIADWVADILRNWQWNNEDLMKASEDALTAAKNNYTSNMLAIQQQYGTVWMQAQQQLANNVQNFITQAENIYDNALNRQQQNLSNLITNFSNLNALSYNNLQLRNAKIQQFQSESMNLNRNQLQWLAQQLGMDSASYQDLVNYQVQAVANELNWYKPWAWMQFQWEIQGLLDQWYTPNQAIQIITSSPDFMAMQTANSEWSRLNDNTIFDKNSGTFRNAGGGSWGYNSNWVYQFTDAEVRTWDTIWNDINSIWHILDSEDWLRVGTYTNSNWYTYNVYANREDWIKATENLLKRAYYWMTLADAAQKWIWQWKDISGAKSVIKQKWLWLDEKLSDSNVRKFIEAIWQWEWTLKWQSLNNWATWGNNLWWYWENIQEEWYYDPSLTSYFENWFKISKDDRANTLKEYWITQKDFNIQYNNYFDNLEKTEAVENITKLRDTAQELLDWNKKNSSKWAGSLHSWKLDLETYKEWSYERWPRWLFQWQTKASEWLVLYNFLKSNQSLDKFLEAKKNGWTFWQMSNAEWQLIWTAASKLNWEDNDKDFEKLLQDMIDQYNKALDEIQWWWGRWLQGTIDLSGYGRS